LTETPHINPGVRSNPWQVALLVLINALVGGMVGLQRTLVPLVGTEEFGLNAGVIVGSFIIAFGLVKAVTNLASGILADRFSRKTVLITGWLAALPVPFLLAWGPSWSWIVTANVFLGLSQGFTWSMTVNMKIDLALPRERGLVMGLNEAAGYGAVGITALLTGYLAAIYGLRPEPFYIGIAYALLGLLFSLFLVRDTLALTQREAGNYQQADELSRGTGWVVLETSWRNKTLFSISQAGFVNNLNDGIAWVAFPLLFAAAGLTIQQTGLIIAAYPLVWGLGQLFTGPLSDRIGRKRLIVAGMTSQAIGYAAIAFGLATPFESGMAGAVILGVGTAMVYPVLIAAVSDASSPAWRATSLGVYRFWRDLGYAAGALLGGLVIAHLGLVWSIHTAAILTFLSGLAAWRWMRETLIVHRAPAVARPRPPK
jgi:MFS family permease